MDQSHLLTHTDTNLSVKSTHRFLIANIIALVVILLGSVGWIIYAHSAKSWPYEPYVRKSGPHGTVKMSDYIKKHQGGTAAAQSTASSTAGATATAQT